MRVRSMSSWWALALVAVVACDPGSGGRADGAESKVAAAERPADAEASKTAAVSTAKASAEVEAEASAEVEARGAEVETKASAEVEAPAEPVLPVLGPASFEEVVAALALLPRLEASTVEACFPDHEVEVMHPGHPNQVFVLRKGADTIAYLVTDHGPLLVVSIDDETAIGGFSQGGPFSAVIESPDTRCWNMPEETCTLHCSLPSGWSFATSQRRCPDEDFELVTKERAEQLARRGRIEQVYWDPKAAPQPAP